MEDSSTQKWMRCKRGLSNLSGRMGMHVCGLSARGGDLLTATGTAGVEPLGQRRQPCLQG